MDLTFADTVKKGAELVLLDGETQIFSFTALRDFSTLVISAPALQLDVPYTLTENGIVQQHGGKGAPLGPIQPPTPGAPGTGTLPDPNDGPPPQKPEGEGSGNEPPAPPSGGSDLPPADENELPFIGIELPPETFTPSDATQPSGNRPEPPEGDRPTPPDGNQPTPPNGEQPTMSGEAEETSEVFTVTAENHSFFNVTAANGG